MYLVTVFNPDNEKWYKLIVRASHNIHAMQLACQIMHDLGFVISAWCCDYSISQLSAGTDEIWIAKN